MQYVDTIHPKGWIALVQALNNPCECEPAGSHRRKNWNRGRHFRTCKKNPFPYPGFRWYREELREFVA